MALVDAFNVALIAELQNSIYNNLDATAAWNQFNKGVPTVVETTSLKPFTAIDIMGCVSVADRAKVVEHAAILGINDSISANDRVAIANWAQLCVDDALITVDEQTAINAVLSSTVTTSTTVYSEPRIRTEFHTVFNPVTDTTMPNGIREIGFPNFIEVADFTVAWQAAGRQGSVSA